jgi:hypothetical protein
VRRTLGLALWTLLLATPSLAEVRRLEVVGVVPAGADAQPGVPARQAALAAALAQGVERVARSLLPEEAAADPDFDLGGLLGGKPRDFTVGYKVLEDRGERRALLLADPEISTEYVLLVEVFVDVARVENALDAAGLRLAAPLPGAQREVRLVVETGVSYAAYQALRRHLLERGGAISVVPLLFEGSERIDLLVVAAGSPSDLMDRLVRSPPEGLSVEPVSADGQFLRVRVVELPRALED